MSRDRGACGLGRRGEERLGLGRARGLPGDDERGDHEQRADEEERRERAGAAGVLLTANDRVDFELLHASPVLSNGWALLGEPSKWVPVTSQRVASVAPVGAGLQVEVRGVNGEAVSLSFAFSPGVASAGLLEAGTRLPVRTMTCVVPESGMARFSMPSGACSPL